MKCAPSGRILNLVCPAYQLADADFSDTLCEEKEYKAAEAFGLSKLALVLFTKQLARQLEGKRVINTVGSFYEVVLLLILFTLACVLR